MDLRFKVMITRTSLLPFCVLSAPGLVPVCFGAALPVACGSIYKSFAQCLLTLGDSLVETQKDQNTQDIDSVCRYVRHCGNHVLRLGLSWLWIYCPSSVTDFRDSFTFLICGTLSGRCLAFEEMSWQQFDTWTLLHLFKLSSRLTLKKNSVSIHVTGKNRVKIYLIT